MGQCFGYGRVSTVDQDLALQINDLKSAGCKQIFTDKISGTKNRRPGLDECLRTLRPGDPLVVWRLDRLGRSMQHLVSVVTESKSMRSPLCKTGGFLFPRTAPAIVAFLLH
jgi:DNA invertase Pin-like site-specific DNA recombinase